MSTSGRLAVAMHVFTLLASTGGPVPSSLIAGSVGTNPALTQRLVAQSADTDFVISQMGATGSVALARPIDWITSLDTLRVVEAPVLIMLPSNASNLACEVGREITGVLERVMEYVQVALEVGLAAQTIASILSEVGCVQRRRRRA